MAKEEEGRASGERDGKEPRAARLAEALRANLKRRKAQARGRREEEGEQPDGETESPEG